MCYILIDNHVYLRYDTDIKWGGADSMEIQYNVYDFGAVGDGVADDTAAIQAAIDKGAETGTAVYFPAGQYRVGELFVRNGSVLNADPQWGYSYQTIGKSVLIQRHNTQKCILNLSKAHGATLNGLSLTGEGKEGGCCGILSNKTEFGNIEDAYRIERCRVAKFSGHAVFLDKVWCFSARHNMFCFSEGDGLRIHGWDGFVSDNWFSGNHGAGFASEGDNCSVTMTGNRVEWNQGGGIVISGGSHYNITGNYIDRSGKAGILMTKKVVLDDDTQEMQNRICNTTTITGNIIYRSGKFAATAEESCHILLDGCAGITVVGNTLCIGRDDKGEGSLTPETAMILRHLKECVVSNNTMFMASSRRLIQDESNHKNQVVIENNVGSLYPTGAFSSEKMGLPTNIIIDFHEELKKWF